MKVSLLPSSVSGEPYQFLTSYLINDTVAIDCGSAGLYRDAEAQARIRHIFLSHSHIDHIGALPILVENAYDAKPQCVTVHASDHVLDCLRRDIFNGRVWPDFIGLSKESAPFLHVERLTDRRTVRVEGLRITPVEVHHVVPTFGYIVEDDRSAIVIPTDTAPTEAIWQAANQLPHLKAVFLEATFPDDMADLARISKHLTPRMFASEIAKVKRPCRFLAVHLKPRFRSAIVDEFKALDLPNVEIAEPGREYQFGE